MEPITKEMLQKACSNESIIKNKENQLRENAMSIVKAVYDKVKSSMNSFTNKDTSCYCVYRYFGAICGGKNIKYNPEYTEKAIEILKEYFPDCKITHFITEEQNENVNQKRICYVSNFTIDWS